MSTDTIYRTILKVNATHFNSQILFLPSNNVYTIVTSLMMAQNRSESTWEINNYGKYKNQFPPNTIKSIRQYERINKKICRQKKSIIFVEICIYI